MAVKNNHGQECVIAIDVTCDPTKEKSKLSTIQGKREDEDPSKFNRNKNLPSVRKELGIDKHIVLVLNHKHLPNPEVIVNELYATANLPAQTRVVNLHSYVNQVTLTNPVSTTAVLNQQQNFKLISVLEQLPERELIATIKRIQAYFTNKPPQPPTSAEQLATQQQVEKLQSQIGSLLKRQESQVTLLEAMQKNPLRGWNKKYDKAFNELEQTMQLVQKTIAQKDQKHHQLQVWTKQTEIYQAWVSAPQTKQMYQVAEALKLPQIQQRINQIQNKLQQTQQNQRRERGRGMSL